MPKYVVSRVDGKGKKFVITSVYADSFRMQTNNDNVIPYSEIVFHTSQERMFRDPVIGRVASMLVSGDVVVEAG